MEELRFSLIMATYGRCEEIRDFLLSIENSNYDLEKIEIIIVDQNDKINLENIIQEFENKLKITHIKSKIKGLSQNRNIGLKHATGDIIAFPDDDCEYLEDTLQIVNENLNNKDIDVIMGRIVERDGSDSLRKWPKEKININKSNFYTKCSSITMFYKKYNNMYFNEKLGVGNFYGSCEDSDILYRTLKLKKNILYNPVLRLYHPHYSSSHNMSLEKVRNYALGFGAFCKSNLDFSVLILFLKAEAYHIIKMIIGIFTFNKEQVKKSFTAFSGRIKGFFNYKE